MIRFNFLFPGELLVFIALLLFFYVVFGLGGIVAIVALLMLPPR